MSMRLFLNKIFFIVTLLKDNHFNKLKLGKSSLVTVFDTSIILKNFKSYVS